MKTNKLKELIKRIVNESLDSLMEDHQRGEWWIYEDGSTTFADIDIGDSGHEGVVIQYVAHEILEHFGIQTDEPGYISEYEDLIKENLMSDGRMSEKDLEKWEKSSGKDCPYTVILKKLIEDKAYSSSKQAAVALSIAYGSSSIDARNYGMQYLGWKIMKAGRSIIEIQTWTLESKDLEAIVRGIWDIVEDSEDPEDEDNKVEDDGFSGPRVNLTIQSNARRFHNVPLAILEKKVPSAMLNYRSGLGSDFREGINEDYHFHHNEYRLYEGNRHIVAVFEDNSRLKFEVHFRDKRGIDKEKWRQRAMSRWKSLANQLHSDVPLSDGCNPIQKSWKQCFAEALQLPDMKEFVRENPHHQVFRKP